MKSEPTCKWSIFCNLLLPLILLCFFSCRGDNKGPNAFNLNKFNQLVASKKRDYSNFLIIPGSGCQGCISDAEQFVIQNAKHLEDKILIVFTNIGSEKLLKLRLGAEVSNGPNILLDARDELHYKSIYPVYFELKNGDILNFKPLKVNDIYTLEVE